MTPSPDERQLESKILFIDGSSRPRSIKGVIANEDNDFLTLTRRNGQIRINKKFVIKIETRM